MVTAGTVEEATEMVTLCCALTFAASVTLNVTGKEPAAVGVPLRYTSGA
jgi:hypothetical protein